MDSAVETGGWAVMRVTRQLWEDSMAASRRIGFKWPIPALGMIAICGGEWWLMSVADDIVECGLGVG